ncbi:putative ankyrin repeat-containing domain, PGG domain, ankyrin repeat-containing domain superfamily [Helianthus annuus]|uniref:Ankyrin repeat-containing domain, PGG domain, ankyrin repeat-containing domain superfamily n=2 Tax=Helianthus annuus TaxID=4232 RepID=A0A9K3IVL9_HELAN|nr:ankyrin repeat-containing protein At5g02620 [Helianthus annuus]KAF5803654.1 putative ankyrin repeat-containing domain, PGG domain, ankyrin repeat-containing domain superfamily [Helianthus annuus]KAJ0561576.1 putative ankyrin repeat-containing domain, PGG domain, ankyrin repeat-containing domain superfamily [Helianthus annuus]KAJ0574641.1 putative ankyrin repeat-containing domain, PGG domain, ankyrin repeat-containing domain superfamily [Helianthus annuus]KAJ0738970.1 putative ankyrin repeat-
MALTEAEAKDLRTSSELYEALINGEDDKVIETCLGIPEGPLHTPTIHEDTVLALATNLKKNDLVLELLDMVPMHESHKLTCQNIGGNTILHEASYNNKTVEAATVMLARAPMLLGMTNRLGETALFTAAASGKTEIFKLLHREVCRTIHGPALKSFLQRDHDKSTILHKAILSRNYWLAHEIAVKHPHLINENDVDEMTPLQLLSCSPPVFGPKSFLMRMIYKLIDADIEDANTMFPWLRKIKKEKYQCEWAMKLVKVLVKADTSWRMTESYIKKGRSKVHLYGKSQSIDIAEQDLKPLTPLLLATINGCIEIVEEILRVYPQAIDHIDHDGRNILSLAILHRRIEIIDLVDKLKTQKLRVRRKIDNYGNTLLHLVAEREDEVTEDLKGPALVLQEDTLLFKRIKEMCKPVDAMKLNSKGKTAEQLFFDNNNKLRSDAKEWMSENAKNCSIVAVLIATVAFAAAYTVPGGPDSKTGYPVLKNKPLFLIFTIADAISLSSSLTSVIIFLNIVTSSFRFKDFETSMFQKLHLGLTLLIVAVTMMMVAFAATLILTISSGRKWTDITLYTVSFFPVLIFVFTYIRFYKQLGGAIYRAFKQMIDEALEHYRSPKPIVWQYNRHSRHQTVDGSRILV